MSAYVATKIFPWIYVDTVLIEHASRKQPDSPFANLSSFFKCLKVLFRLRVKSLSPLFGSNDLSARRSVPIFTFSLLGAEANGVI